MRGEILSASAWFTLMYSTSYLLLTWWSRSMERALHLRATLDPEWTDLIKSNDDLILSLRINRTMAYVLLPVSLAYLVMQ